VQGWWAAKRHELGSLLEVKVGCTRVGERFDFGAAIGSCVFLGE
jgi:hypothetical protein